MDKNGIIEIEKEYDKMIYGYARVSTKEQNLDRQIIVLREAVPDERNIITDKQSGKTFDRKGYNSLVGTETTAPMLREGDTLIIVSLDRLGRDYAEIQKQWQHITQTLKVNIRVLDMPVLNTAADSKLETKLISDIVLQLLAFVAEKERKSTLERQRQGIEAMPYGEELTRDGKPKKVSKKTNKAVGRPQLAFPDKWEQCYHDWKDGKVTAKTCMEQLKLKRSTFYKLANIYKEHKAKAMQVISSNHPEFGGSLSDKECCKLADIDIATLHKYIAEQKEVYVKLKAANSPEAIAELTAWYTAMMNGET